MSTKTIAIFAACIIVLSCSLSQAVPVTIHISGRVTYANGSGLPDSIHVGDVFTGTYTYDSATPDSDALPNRGRYQHESPSSFVLSLGGYEFKTSTTGGFTTQVWNNFTNPLGSSYDSYSVASGAVSPLPDIAYYNFSWNLRDDSTDAISSEALPSTAPVLSDWNSNYLQLSSGNSFLVNGTVTSVMLVPEPVTVLLLGLGTFLIRRKQ